MPYVANDQWVYGGGVIIATSAPNIFSFSGSNSGMSAVLQFTNPVSNVSFYRVELLAGPNGITHPEWQVTAYAGTTVLGSVGEGYIASYTDVPAQQFSLPFAGITSMLVSSNAYNTAAFGAVQMDNLAFNGGSASPEFSISVPGATISSSGELSFCSSDTVTCTLTNAPPPGGSVHWLVSSLDPDPQSFAYVAATPNQGVGSAFNIQPDVSQHNWVGFTPDYTGGSYEARDPLGFTVTAYFVDQNGSPVGGQVSKDVQQDLLGQLRQEYVDFSVPACGIRAAVPTIAEFTSAAPPGYNTGDYPWAIVSPWSTCTAPQVLAKAVGMHIATSVTSCYRNPVRQANVYLNNGVTDFCHMSWGSQHLHGSALDFAVLPLPADHSHYMALKQVCDQYGHVVLEGMDSHVHLQPEPHKGCAR
jgi:hypothetical protein